MPIATPFQRTRLAVLGLDGLPLDLARRLCSAGRLPHLARIIQGARSLDAELPELSPVNWASFATARGPEDHGIFGFTRIDSQTYNLSLTDFTHFAAPTVFDLLGRRGYYSKVLNLPATYPARPFEGTAGVLVSGFVAQEFRRSFQPPVLAQPLAASSYKLEADTTRGARDPEFLLAELHETLASRRRALDLLWPDLAWDVFVLVLTETDRLFHFLFSAVEDQAHCQHQAVAAFLEQWDDLVGEVITRFEALPEPKRLLVLADHGFTALETEFDLNAWLRREGLLKVPAGPPVQEAELDASAMDSRSLAFALDPGRIYLHTRERFGRGGLSSSAASRLRAEIRDKLLCLTWEGEPVMDSVSSAEELYPGPQAARAPDLVCTPRPGFDLKAKFNRTQVFGRDERYGRQGAHTAHGAFFYDSLGSQPRRVRDVGLLALETFGLKLQTMAAS